MRPFAACERLRLLAPQAPRRGFAASWRSRKRLGGSRRQQELAAPESLAWRRTRSVRPEGPRVVVASALAPLGGEPSWGRVRLPHQQKRAADLRWSSSAHSECLTCGRARYTNSSSTPSRQDSGLGGEHIFHPALGSMDFTPRALGSGSDQSSGAPLSIHVLMAFNAHAESGVGGLEQSYGMAQP